MENSISEGDNSCFGEVLRSGLGALVCSVHDYFSGQSEIWREFKQRIQDPPFSCSAFQNSSVALFSSRSCPELCWLACQTRKLQAFLSEFLFKQSDCSFPWCEKLPKQEIYLWCPLFPLTSPVQNLSASIHSPETSGSCFFFCPEFTVVN